MKHCGTLWLIIAGSTALLAVSAFGLTDTGGANPYQRIVDRNVFGLRPPPPPPDPNEQPAVAPAKILLQGITDILGRKQVLMKVQPPPPGKEFSLVLSEGQREGDVEVLEINESAGTVKVNNFGVVQPLSLEKDAAKVTAAPAAAPGAPGAPGVPGVPVPPVPAIRSAPGVPTASAMPLPGATASGGLRTIPTRQVRSANTAGVAGTGATVGGVATQSGPRPGQNWPPETHLGGEEGDLLIEALRKANENNPNYPPLPPTRLNPTANLAPQPPAPQ